jgi:hypothetical protein
VREVVDLQTDQAEFVVIVNSPLSEFGLTIACVLKNAAWSLKASASSTCEHTVAIRYFRCTSTPAVR